MWITSLHRTVQVQKIYHVKNIQHTRKLSSLNQKKEEAENGGEGGINRKINLLKNNIYQKLSKGYEILPEKLQGKRKTLISSEPPKDTEILPENSITSIESGDTPADANTEISYVEPIVSSLCNREDDGRSIPMLILPHTVKRAYHLNIHTTKVPRVQEKYSWVTKTIATPGLPRQYSGDGRHTVDNYDELLQEYHDVLHHTVACAKIPLNKSNARHIPNRIDFNLLWDILRLTTRYGPDAEHLRSENSFLFHKPLVETHWIRNEGYAELDDDHDMDSDLTPFPKFLRTKFQPEFVLRTKNGLGLIEDPNEGTAENLGVDLPSPADMFSLNTYRQHTIFLGNRPGMGNFIQAPQQHTHTTLLHYHRLQTPQQLCASAVLASFSQLASQAQAAGFYHGTELSDPLVSHCIVTNGHQMMFVVYQLNTLCTQDDEGVWNRAWYSPSLNMFQRRVKSGRDYMVFEDGQSCGSELEGFNEDCFRLLMLFMRMNTV